MYLLLQIDTSFLNREFFHQKVADYLIFAGIILLVELLKRPMAYVLSRLSTRIAMKYAYMRHKEKIRELLFKPFERLLQAVLYFFAAEQLSGILDRIVFKRQVSSKQDFVISLSDITDHIFLLLFIFFLTQTVVHFIDFVYYVRMGKAREENNAAREQMLPLIREMSKLFAWIVAGFWILGSVAHVNVPALITGLGIGGVAIALAAKESVENFFAAFTILSDKPFQTGDFIKLGEVEGTVERIGFRSTRLRNADGSAHLIPNQSLVSQSLINHSTRAMRGMKVVANIRYGVPREALDRITTEIREALSETAPVIAPITVVLETLDKETFQLITSYTVPHPLPEGENLLQIKHRINMIVYGIITDHAQLGVSPAAN